MAYVITVKHGVVVHVRDLSEVRQLIQISSTLFFVAAHKVYELVELVESGKFLKEVGEHLKLFAATTGEDE